MKINNRPMGTDEAELKRQLVALLVLFRDKPNILVNYLLHYDALKKDFKERIKTNAFLHDISSEFQEQHHVAAPIFLSLAEMQKYYNQAFQRARETKSPSVLGISTEQEVLLVQLHAAVSAEDYDRAARIKKYMDESGMDTAI